MSDETLREAFVEKVARPILADVMEAAGFDPAAAADAKFISYDLGRGLDPRVEITIDTSGEYPAMAYRATMEDARQGWRLMLLLGSRDPRQVKRGFRMWTKLFGGSR